MTVGKRVADARLGVEEVVGTVDVEQLQGSGRVVVIVVYSGDFVMDVPVLHITEDRQAARHLPVDFGEDVGVVLGRGIAVIFGLREVGHFFHAENSAPVFAVVHIPRSAHREREMPRSVVGRRDDAAEIVVHGFTADEVGFGYFGAGYVDGGKVVFLQLLVVLVILVVAVAVGVVPCHVERPAVVETVADNQMVVDLQVVVLMVVVEADDPPFRGSPFVEDRIARSIVEVSVDFALGIVAAVFGHLVFRKTGIGEVHLGLAAERKHFDHGASAVITGLEHIGFQVGGSAVHIPVRSDMGNPCIQRPVSAQKTGRNLHGLPVGVVGAVGQRSRSVEDGRKRFGGHVYRAAESARAIGRSAGAALELERPDGRCQVGRVVPIDRMGFGVVHRHAVHGYVDAGGIRSAHPHRGAADARSRFGSRNHRRHGLQQPGYVLTEVLACDLFA